MRILGLSLDSADFRLAPGAKNAGIFAALHRRFGVVGMLSPTLSRPEEALRKLRHIHPDRAIWRKRYNLHPDTFERRTALLERELTAWDGRFDWIVQLHTQFGPGRGGRPYVLHTDNTYVLSERHYPPWAPLRGRVRDARVRLEREVYQAAAFLFPRSEWLRRSLIDDYGCDPARVIRVGGGANIRSSSVDGRSYDQQTALFVGLEFERKGGLVLLRAWERVRRALPGARLQIVGEPNRWGAPPKGVEWIGPVHDRAEMARLYEAATVFVMPSLFEPWGHVFYEAMGSGLGCIGTSTCAMPEIIADGKTGVLVRPGDEEELADALIATLKPDRARELGAAGHASVMAGHSWDDVVEKMAAGLADQRL